MKCRDIMSKRLETLSEKDSIARAAIVMKESQVGFLPICGADRKVMGVVTDRDLVTRGLAKGCDPKTTSAAMIMTAPAITCLADTDLRAAEELMVSERLSRLVVTNGDGTIAGVLSVVDLVEHTRRSRTRPATAQGLPACRGGPREREDDGAGFHGRAPRLGDEGVPVLRPGPLMCVKSRLAPLH
jgi:CBS domain-containing protein